MTLIILFGLGLFVAFMLCLVLLMGRSSTQGALLEQVAREARGSGPISGPWRPVSADAVARPFTALRRIFSAEPDPEIVRRAISCRHFPGHEVSRTCSPGAEYGNDFQR